MSWDAPVDSTEARERRDFERAEADALDSEKRLHAVECRGGWRGEDEHGRPRPCLACRPHLARVNCRTCSAPAQSCRSLHDIGRGPCCPDCDHDSAPAYDHTKGNPR